MAATFTVPGAILDGMAPHLWVGPTAAQDWYRDVLVEGEQHGASDHFVTVVEPLHNDVTGDSAYIVVPATMTFKVRGKQVTQSGAIFTVAGGCGWLNSGQQIRCATTSKQKAPLAGAKYQGGTIPSHCRSLPYAACNRQRFKLICDQIWQNKCKHLGNSRRTYTSRQCAYPFMRWTHDLDLEMVGSQSHKVIDWERHDLFIERRK